MSEQRAGDVPPEVAKFWELVPTFRMLEFIFLPDERWAPEDWSGEQANWLSADPASSTERVLAELPSGEMLVFDLRAESAGYPLGVCELGFPERAVAIGLTISDYLDLAMELAPLEAQMFDGRYPYEAIVAAFERRGLQENEYWSGLLADLAETRSGTEERMSLLREGR